jgi:hypothetical protein
MASLRLLPVVLFGTLLTGCGATRASDRLPDPGRGPADLVASWTPVDGFDDFVRLEVARGDETVVLEAAWSTRFDLVAAWGDGAGRPVLWVYSSDIGTTAFDVAEFPVVRSLDCGQTRSEFELLASSELPDELDLDKVTCL